jgi:muramidase (phage lysozyme)
MITRSEIPDNLYKISDKGYAAVVGNNLFPRLPNGKFDYSKHPNDKRYIKNLGIFSTAAGAYQILYRFWVVYQKQLGLHDFGPASQDQVALQLLNECHCLADIDVGDVSTAVMKCSSRWASLPGNLDGQHKNKMGELLAWYTEAFSLMA